MGWIGLDGVFSTLSPIGVMPRAGRQRAWRADAAAAALGTAGNFKAFPGHP